MATATQRQTPSRNFAQPSTSTARPQARRSRPLDPSSDNKRTITPAREASAVDADPKPTFPPKLVNTPPSQQGYVRSPSVSSPLSLFFNATNATSGSPQPEVLQPVPSPPKTSERAPFSPRGIPAYHTRATIGEVCRMYLFRRGGCFYGKTCPRIHPLDKEAHRNRINAALSVPQITSIAAGPIPASSNGDTSLDQGRTQVQVKLGSPSSLLLSNPTPVVPPQTELDLIDSLGWDASGSWMPVSKPEAWTESSPSTSSNAQLFSASSGSSSPATTSPELSEDEKEKTPLPARSRPFSLPCAVFRKGGNCPRGDRCFFKHVRDPSERHDEPFQPSEPKEAAEAEKIRVSPETPKVLTPPKPATPVLPVIVPESQTVVPSRPRRPRPPTTERCIKHLRGRCPFGYACRFIHDDLQYDDEPPPANPPKPSSALPKYISPADDFLLSFILHDHIRVQCSAGFDIQRIQTAFESSTLLVSNISPRVQPARLKEILNSYGVVEELRMPVILSAASVVTIRYSDAAEAQKAQDTLNGMKMFDLTLNARIASTDAVRSVATALLKDTSVRITWEAPAKEVYAGYSNKEQAERALRIVQTTPLNGHYLRAEIYEGMPAVDIVNVRIHGVPVNVDKADLVRFINPVDIMWSRPNYTDFNEAERHIRSMMERCGGLEHFEILPPPYRDGGMVKAWANFGLAAKAKEAARRLDKRRPKCTGLSLVRAKHVQTISYSLPQEKFAKISAAIENLQASQRGLNTTVVVSRGSGLSPVIVRLSAEEQKELAHLKHQFETILKGEIVRSGGKTVWDSHFARPEGRIFLQDLAIKNPSVHFECNIDRFMIRLYGFATDRARFANSIIAKVKELKSQVRFEISLAGRLMGAVLINEDFKKRQLQHGLDHAHIDVVKRILVVRGDFTVYRAFKNLIDQIEQQLPLPTNYDGPSCPVCFGKPTSPARLQCGHEWCRDCLTNYFRAATEQRTFPLKCLGNDGRCGTKIPIGVAKWVLSGQELESIFNAAFLAHIQSRPKDFHYCPTPDCPQVYRTTQQKATLQCPACLSSICTRCHAEAHDGFQCADQVQDELFKKWMEEHDVKHCPTCNVPIEKMEGCNHMMCTHCQTHICWQCLKTFPNGEGIYGHMREVHGTFGLGVGFD